MLGLGLVIVAIASGSGARWLWERSRRLELGLAREDMAANRFGLARQRLAHLAERWADDGEVLLLLGECELARGHREEALEAWRRVPDQAPSFARAASLQATHLINSGRYRPAEDILLRAIASPAVTVTHDLERTLCRVYRFEGRFDDVRQVLRRSWCRSPDPAGVLRELWLLDHSPMPVESWGAALEKADGEDDRVWLGRARHDLATGRFAECARWLSLCEKRRPEDPAVWQAALDLALAEDDVALFWKAAAHHPARRMTEPDLHAIRAWLADRQRNRQAEQRELELLVRDHPGDTKAVEQARCPDARGRPAARSRAAPPAEVAERLGQGPRPQDPPGRESDAVSRRGVGPALPRTEPRLRCRGVVPARTDQGHEPRAGPDRL